VVSVSDRGPAGRHGMLLLEGGHLVWEIAGAGPPVVLLHGFSLDRRMWDAVVPLLATDFTVVRYDLRGFGESAPMDLHLAYSHAEDLVALLDHLQIDAAVLVGFSFGAHPALQLALQEPERVSGVVLVDALVEGVRWDEPTMAATHAVTAALHDHGIEAAKEAWLAHPFFAPANQQPDVASALSAMVARYSGRHWLGEDPARTDDPRPLDALAHVGGPVTIVVGELDVPAFADMSAVLAREIPAARLVTIADIGHMTPMEAPVRVAEEIRMTVGAAQPGGLSSPA
jgi:3-oxoadipate enol-lactonase